MRRYRLGLLSAVLSLASIALAGTKEIVPYLNSTGTITGVTGTGPVASTGGTSPVISLSKADGSTNGYLGSADWTAFNAKEAPINFTAGSVPYAGVSGDLTQDNANLFWDATNHRLGIGTATPATSLDIGGVFQVDSAGGFKAGTCTNSGCGYPGFEVDDTGDPTVVNGVAYTWPTTQGASSTVLTNNGSGTLTWAAGGGGGPISQAGLTFNDGTTPTPNTVTIGAPTAVTTYQLFFPIAAPTSPNVPLVADASGSQLAWGTPLTGFVTTSDLTTKLGNNVAAKNPAFYYCESNITLSGTQTCDGQSIGGGPALVANQTTTSDNGLYTTNPTGAWVLDPSWLSSNCDGMIVSVGTGGTSYGDTVWQAVCPSGDSSGGVTFRQLPTSTRSGVCTVGSTTLSTTATNLTCTGVPASAAVAVSCSGAAAFSTATADALYCRATGTVNQIACNTVVANSTAMTFACMWMQP